MNKQLIDEALKSLDIGFKCYMDSQMEMRKDPELVSRLEQSNEEVRLQVDKQRDIEKSYDEMKKIYLKRLSLDRETMKKLASLRTKPGGMAEFQKQVMVDNTQNMDMIYIEDGVKLPDLLRAIKEMNLDDDPLIKDTKEKNR